MDTYDRNEAHRCCECGLHLDDLPYGLIALRAPNGAERYICDDCRDNPAEVD